ncbi:MAG: hypothetical protein D6732_18480 [Methanobacteriota archaeon]|nr:MAG: hypothetical protein D6732_18480 [Euryarchaeota archaeon]
MGKNCSGCRYFREEKVHHHPQLLISEEEYEAFQKELREFEDWLEEHLNREVNIHGRVDGVKPLFQKRMYDKGNGFSFSGFLLIFKELYFGRELMEDPVYARLSPKTYASLKLGRGDVLSARATLTLDRGRLVLKKLRRIDIEERGEPPFWDKSKALVARETATRIPTQPEGCMQCPFGSLVDVEDVRNGQSKHYRQLYCLRGMPHYLACDLYSHYSDSDENLDESPPNSAACTTRKVNVARKT